MLKKRWPGKVISDKGFEIQIKNRGSIIYKEGKKKLCVGSEWLEDSNHYWIIADSIKKWQPPFDKDIIEVDKKEQIIENIKTALEYIDAQCDIDRNKMRWNL